MSVRLMRGQVVVRELDLKPSNIIWTPNPKRPRDVKIHRGLVLGMGPPAKLHNKRKNAPEVPYDFKVGDEVLYVFAHHQEAWTRPWPPDGKPATWVPQACVQCVLTVTPDRRLN